MIRRFTTPLVRVTVAKDLSEADEIFVTFSQSQSYVTKVKKDMWYATSDNRVKNISGSAGYWWERSPSSSYSDSFCIVTPGGSAVWLAAGGTSGIAPCGCI